MPSLSDYGWSFMTVLVFLFMALLVLAGILYGVSFLAGALARHLRRKEAKK